MKSSMHETRKQKSSEGKQFISQELKANLLIMIGQSQTEAERVDEAENGEDLSYQPITISKDEFLKAKMK